MNMHPTLTGLSLLFSAAAFNANAALTGPYLGAGNVGLVYSSVSNVTWTQDANLFKTLYDADNTLVSQIAAVTPTYNDSYWGLQTIDASDFNTSDGQMTWLGGLAFASYLNSISYGGSNQWRLPTSNGIFGYDGTAGNELGQLFYSELGGTAGNSIPNTATFNNEQAAVYWSGTEYAPPPLYAWYFLTSGGTQHLSAKLYHYYAWAVSPGQVPAVPVPGAVWLMGSGLLGLLSLKRRGHAG
jgi:hypothetical protein